MKYKQGGRIGFAGGGMDMGNASNQAQSAAMGNSTSAPGPGDTGGEGGDKPSDGSDTQSNGGDNPPTNVGNPFGYQDNTLPTNVGNPFGYQDHIMQTVLNNRYKTDLDEDNILQKSALREVRALINIPVQGIQALFGNPFNRYKEGF